MAETSVSQAAIYRARPTLRFDGQEDERAAELVQSMRMHEQDGGLSGIELRFSNWASTPDGGASLAFSSGSKLALGAALIVYLGEEASPCEIFRGRITALELEYATGEPPTIVALAEDALQAARLTRRSRTWTDKTPADVVKAIASDLGLRPVIAGLTSPSGTWAQLAESDLAFLRRLLERFDADLQIAGEELQVSPRADVKRNAIELQMHGQLGRARVRADLADQATSVSVRGWDAAQGSVAESTADSGTHLGPGSGKTGAQLLRDAFGARHERVAQVSVATNEEATVVAQTAFDQRARRFVKVDGTTEGNPKLRVGSHVTLTGLDTRFDNTYYVTQACHLFDLQHGYRTEFSAECAYLAG
ncbi:phage late control D family protein [Variovorax rhizosphaerae]|uniref:Contractile injection system protein, VgrG/Pvc8 family n=1 Tax=Variovorax rhizosphaerae TaxID=1836200 RepID=A0ABU8WVT9_9BURK